MNRFLLPALLVLAACGTPQEQCIGQNTRDLRVITGLVAETEANLARGYGLETVVKLRKDYVDCTAAPTAENPTPQPSMCWVDEPYETTQPVALDLNAERAKLTSLRQQQQSLAKQAETIVAQCQALYPE